jgi:monofunctional chorismate mutase
MELAELRKKIDEIDIGITELFSRRMEICGEIAEYKRENGLPVRDSRREEEKLKTLSSQAEEGMGEYIRALYSRIFELSRDYESGKSEAEGDDSDG